MPLESDMDDFLDPLLNAFNFKLKADIAGELATIYFSGSAEMVTYGKTKMGVPIAYEGPPISQAVDWAKKQSATLVKGMDTETKKRLAGVISRGIESKRGIPGTARDIRKWAEELNKDVKQTFVDMSKYRSELIARTETSNALSQASLDRMQEMGIEGKEWVTVGDADVDTRVCEPNGAQRVIPVGEPFQSGDMAPPGHPGCRCALAPARLRK